MLDTNNNFFNKEIKLTFIEPFPQLLKELIKKNNQAKIDLIELGLQYVDISIFKKLEENDFLFIDSTHVVKCGSDIRYLFSEILPSLKPGVIIHIHDIFYPFEMPDEWLKEGRYWNENYFLSTFLQYNNSFKILLFSSYIHEQHSDWLQENMPLCLKNKGGHIWLQKINPVSSYTAGFTPDS
jgi:hypothetical protein